MPELDPCTAVRDLWNLVRALPANQCNHAIVYVPEPGDAKGGRWLDGTAQYSSMESTPWADRGVPALVWTRDGKMSFKHVPQVAPEENLIRMTVEATLSADGSAEARATWDARGQYAGVVRQQFRRVGRRKQQLEAMVTSLQPGGQLTDMAFTDLTDRDGPAEIRFDFRASRYAEPAGAQLILQPKRRFSLSKRYTPRSERHYDVWMAMPSVVEYVEVYRFEPSWEIKSVPETARFDTPWMVYEVRYTTEPGRIRVDKRLVTKATEVPKSAYERLQAFCVAADKAEQETITLVPK